MSELIQSISNFFSSADFGDAGSAFLGYLFFFSRFMLPVAAIAVISRCARSMLRERYEPEVWAYIDVPSGARVPLRSWECTIGSADSCDVAVSGKNVSNPHIVLNRDEDGNWRVYNLGNSGDEGVNDEVIPPEGLELRDSDVLTLGGKELKFFNLTEEERKIISSRRTAPGKIFASGAMFGYLTIFQVILLFQHLCTASDEYRASVGLAFTALFAVMWLYFIIMRAAGRRGLEVEVLAFFLSTVGLSVAATCAPESMLKQIILILVGIAVFLIFGAWLRDLRRVKKMRIAAAIFAGILLVANVAFGLTQFGAKNWIEIGGFTIQPSEFVKLAYVYAGAATLDRLYRKRNLLVFIAFSAACVGALALMGDFGTALVFFSTFLVISFLRSGSFSTIILAVTGAGLAGFLAISAKPYIAQRFAHWGRAWEDVNGAGFQQTRALSATASGGLFGRGGGNGWLHNIVASETDLSFEVVSEELGLVVALCAVAAIILMAVFIVRNAAKARSSFYVIAGVGAISMMMVQMSLNVFGSVDILPFTGVTFPFVSMGGSSLISCWAMLAFVKATDTRKNSSFVVKSPTKIRDSNEFTQWEQTEDEDYIPEDEPFVEDVTEQATRNGRNLFDRRGERKGRRK